MPYEKFVYWLAAEKFSSLKNELEADGRWRDCSQKAVCAPLSPDVEMGYILPATWENFKLCRRQLSWYGASHHAGSVLAVSSLKLDKYDAFLSAIIRKSKYKPEKFPGREERQKLITQESYQKQKPDRWEDIASGHPGMLDKWLKLIGLEHISFGELFIRHCANHANFIDPVYYVSEESGPVPYSIDKTKYVCSACMEFYNIIGENHHKKLVVPCPGAVKFANLPEDQYFEVMSVNKPAT